MTECIRQLFEIVFDLADFRVRREAGDHLQHHAVAEQQVNFPNTVGLIINAKFRRRGNRAVRAFGERRSECAAGPAQLQRFDYLFGFTVVRNANYCATIVEAIRGVIAELPAGNGVDLKIGKAIRQMFRRLRRVEWRSAGNEINTINVALHHLFHDGVHQRNVMAENFFHFLNHIFGDQKVHGAFINIQHFIFSR